MRDDETNEDPELAKDIDSIDDEPQADVEISSEHEEARIPDDSKIKKFHKKKLLIVIIVIVVVLAAVGVGAWWWFTQRTTVVEDTDGAQTSTVTPVVETDTLLARYITPTTGETWNDVPKVIADPGYLVKDEWFDDNTPPYYLEVGKRGSSVIIESIQAGIGYVNMLFERSSDGTVSFIARPNANSDYSEDTEDFISGISTTSFSDTVKIDTTTHYDSLSLPPTLKLSDTESLKSPTSGYFYASIGSYVNDPKTGKPSTIPDTSVISTIIKKLGYNTLIKNERKYVDTGLTAVSYVVKTPIGTEITLAYEPINAEIDNYTWTNKVDRKGKIGGIVRGCSAAGASVSRTDILNDEDFVAIGKSDKGQVIYGFKDETSPLVEVAYQEYKDFNTYDGGPAVLSFDEFIDNHAIFAYKSTSNGWLIYTIDYLAAVGGCGKPVVYLYPTKTTSVDIQVGADVKISEPLYNSATGWQNVIASPNGQLTYKGLNYSSLFWEGTGYGPYPAITGGTVIPYNEAARTIRSQLAAQGLNTTEIDDFMEYWQPLIPNTPFVRLAWFNTTQLDALAPLSINPHPDTVIRTFLDMKGLDRSITIPGQQFVSPIRHGFTVVEWGGLLHNKL